MLQSAQKHFPILSPTLLSKKINTSLKSLCTEGASQRAAFGSQWVFSWEGPWLKKDMGALPSLIAQFHLQGILLGLGQLELLVFV